MQTTEKYDVVCHLKTPTRLRKYKTRSFSDLAKAREYAADELDSGRISELEIHGPHDYYDYCSAD